MDGNGRTIEYAVIVPLCGGNEYELCKAGSPEVLAVVVAGLLAADRGSPDWIRVERRVVISPGAPY